VDCRIQIADDEGVRIVTIAGRLLGEHVPSLLAACGQARTVHVNLADVVAVDPIAADALRRIQDGGAQLSGASPYIQLKLDSVPSKPRGA
jgi:hypothetical protein